MIAALQDVSVIVRYGDGAVGLTGWGWVVVLLLGALAGRK